MSINIGQYESIKPLTACKFFPMKDCTEERCPAWENGMCCFDIADIVVRKTFDSITKLHAAWKGMNKEQKIQAVNGILERLKG